MALDGYRRQGMLTMSLFLGAGLGATFILLILGTYFVQQYREMQMQGAATAGALYVEGFLAPHAQEILATQNLPAESAEKLTKMLNRQQISDHFAALKIWDQQGKFVFSTDGTAVDDDEDPAEIARVLHGEVLVKIFTDQGEHQNTALEPPFLEIHAPIFDLSTNKIIAVGEVYQDATGFMNERRVVERSIWTALSIFSVFALAGIMLLIALQRKTLLQNLDEVSAIARQNQLLKEDAERTRIEATQSNEQLLNQIGAELHDGPIQMLSLMMLMGATNNGNATTPDGMTSNDIGNRVISELRAISTGLSLPEITDLTLHDVLLLAVSRHETFTGQKVETGFGTLPQTVDQDLKICCYRFVQEGLTNSYKHAAGAAQSVAGNLADQILTLTVQDEGGAARHVGPETNGLNGGTGLFGLRHRLAVFGGDVTFRQQPGGITKLTATIPLQ